MSGRDKKRRKEEEQALELDREVLRKEKEAILPLLYRLGKSLSSNEQSTLHYLRTSSAVSTLIGGAGMILTPFFWVATAFIYFACLLWMIDLFYEDGISRIIRIILALVIALIALGFTAKVVCFPAKLEITSYWTRADRPKGEIIEGISWGPGMSEIRVTVYNPTDRDYDDVDLSIATDEFTFASKETTKHGVLSNCA